MKSSNEEHQQLAFAELLHADLLQRCAADNSGNNQVPSKWMVYGLLILYMFLVESIQTLVKMDGSPFQLAFCCAEALHSISSEPPAVSFEVWLADALQEEDFKSQCMSTLLLL
jgi:hypothetical protein